MFHRALWQKCTFLLNKTDLLLRQKLTKILQETKILERLYALGINQLSTTIQQTELFSEVRVAVSMDNGVDALSLVSPLLDSAQTPIQPANLPRSSRSPPRRCAPGPPTS